MDTTPHSPLELDEPGAAPVAAALPPPLPAPLPPDPCRAPGGPAPAAPVPPAASRLQEPRGCLYALSQPPLMLFLAVIGVLLAVTGFHDLLLL